MSWIYTKSSSCSCFPEFRWRQQDTNASCRLDLHDDNQTCSLCAWSEVMTPTSKKTCLVLLFLQKCVVDSFSPERRWSPSPRQQHRDHRETRGRGNRGLEVLHRYTEDPDQVHHSDDIWCVLLKMALPATVRMNNSHAANIKTHLSVEVKNKCLSVWSLHLHFGN